MTTRLEYFMRHIAIDPSSGCWLWTAAVSRAGYGSFAVDAGKMVGPHRWAYEHFVGSIPDGMVIDHECHNADPACVGGPLCMHRRCANPDHLSAKTHSANVMAAGSRSPSAANAKKTHCHNGHPFDEANTSLYPNGRRRCRMCYQARDRAAYWRRKHAA